MRIYRQQQGYSLVEVLVAVSILMIAIIGPLTIASTGLKNASFAKAQNVAFFLAQEGLEAVVKAREDNALKVFAGGSGTVWDEMSPLVTLCASGTPCGVNVASGFALSRCGSTCPIYLHTGGANPYRHESGGTATGYTRQIVLSEAANEYVRVQSTVSWGVASDEQVVLTLYVYNIYAN